VAAATSAAMQLEALPGGASVRTGAAGAPWAVSSFLSGFACLARCIRTTLTGAGTQLKEVVQGLTALIGEPPRRPFEESAAGMLVWAYDAALVCLIVATCLFALGFATMPPQQCGMGRASGVLGSGDVREFGRLKDTWMLMTVALIVLLGALLGMKSPLVSALICGL